MTPECRKTHLAVSKNLRKVKVIIIKCNALRVLKVRAKTKLPVNCNEPFNCLDHIKVVYFRLCKVNKAFEFLDILINLLHRIRF